MNWKNYKTFLEFYNDMNEAEKQNIRMELGLSENDFKMVFVYNEAYTDKLIESLMLIYLYYGFDLKFIK